MSSKVLVLCAPKRKIIDNHQVLIDYNDSIWPESGPVECANWDPDSESEDGLNGLLWGAGPGFLLNCADDAIWLVVEVEASDIVAEPSKLAHMIGKVKFPKGNVVYSGDRKTATDYIYQRAPQGTAVAGAMIKVGDNQSVAVGYYGIAIAGPGGTATAGNLGTAIAGPGGTATAGSDGVALVGDHGIATTGFGGTSTAGRNGIAVTGLYGHAEAGPGGIIKIEWINKGERRIVVGHVGKDGVKANTLYRVGDYGELVEVETP